MVKSLGNNGKLIPSFRDYSTKLAGIDRFIPVKSDDNKILTYILDYEDEFVYVTDLLQERINDVWKQKIGDRRTLHKPEINQNSSIAGLLLGT